MTLYDVWALEKLEAGSGNYRSLAKLPHGYDTPDTNVAGFHWIKIGSNVSVDEADDIMNQYPQAARSKC